MLSRSTTVSYRPARELLDETGGNLQKSIEILKEAAEWRAWKPQTTEDAEEKSPEADGFSPEDLELE